MSTTTYILAVYETTSPIFNSSIEVSIKNYNINYDIPGNHKPRRHYDVY